MKRMLVFLLIILLCGCANKDNADEEKGVPYQSTISLEPEITIKLFVELASEGMLTNSYVSNEGEIVSGDNYGIYLYPVIKGQNLKIEAGMVGNPNSANRIAFYADAQGRQLVKSGWLNDGGWDDKYTIKAIVPDEAEYLFVSTQNGTIPRVNVTQEGRNYYISSNGELVQDKNYQIMAYAVTPYEIIEIKGAMKGNPNSATRYAFYKDEYGKDLIEMGSLNSGGWEDTYSEKVIVPDEATTLLIGCQNGTESSVSWKSKISYTNNIKLKDKKMGVLGDSMAKGNGTFDGNCWPERIVARNDMKIDNQAINGKYLTQGAWRDSVIGGQADDLSEDCDIIIICAGTNDITAQIPIGEDNSSDLSTLCGTMNALIPKLREKSPKATILCITPFIRYERNDEGEYSQVWKEQREWINKLAELCDKWGVPCFNNTYRSDIAWNNDSDRRFFTGTSEQKYGDDYHLNDVGLEYISYLYEEFIVQQMK